MIRSRTDALTDPALDAQRMKIRALRAELAGTPFMPQMLRPATAQRPVTVPVAPHPGAGGVPLFLVPPGGIAAWLFPDATRLPALVLPPRLELLVEARHGPWAEVRSVNGWRGWVDGRLLLPEGNPAR